MGAYNFAHFFKRKHVYNRGDMLAVFFTQLISIFTLSSSTLDVLHQYCEAEVPQVSLYQAHPTHELRQVHIVARHGDRSPINFLPFESDVTWDCNTVNRRAVGEGHVGAMLYNEAGYLIPESEHPFTKDMWKGNCTNGQLTERGFEQLRSLGEAYRQIYVDDLGWLPARLHVGSVYLRSTDIPRTQMSAEALLLGLYPAHFRPEGAVVALRRKPIQIEDMFANYRKCPRYGERKHELQAMPEFRNQIKKMKPLQSKLAWYIEEEEDSAGSADKEEFYMDSLMCRACHQKALPCRRSSSEEKEGGGGGDYISRGPKCMHPGLIQEVMDHSDWTYDFMYRDTELPSLAVGSFLWDITLAMRRTLDHQKHHQQQNPSSSSTSATSPSSSASSPSAHVAGAADGGGGGNNPLQRHHLQQQQQQQQQQSGVLQEETSYTLGVFGGHDTTIAPLIALLTGGLPDGRWPAYASSVVIEVWAPEGWSEFDLKENDLEGAVVRVLYDGKPVSVKGTQGPEHWCPFSHWLDIVDEFHPESMYDMCRSTKPKVKQVQLLSRMLPSLPKGSSLYSALWLGGVLFTAGVVAYLSTNASQKYIRHFRRINSSPTSKKSQPSY